MEELRTARRTQAERREDARQRVLLAATALVAVHGSRAVSLAAVGAAAGYSRGIVHHHFGSKAQLLEELIKYTQTFDVPADSATGLRRLTDFVGAYLSGLHERSPRSEAFLKLWTESAGAEPSLAELFAERDAQFREVLAQYIVDGIDDGSVRPDVDPQTTAVAIIGLLRGSALMAFSTARDVSAGDLASVAVGGLERSLAPDD
jgi:AcrR family transcriptional regulator